MKISKQRPLSCNQRSLSSAEYSMAKKQPATMHNIFHRTTCLAYWELCHYTTTGKKNKNKKNKVYS